MVYKNVLFEQKKDKIMK